MAVRTRGKHARPTSIFTDAKARARSVRTVSAILVVAVGATALGLSTHESLPDLGPPNPTSGSAETQEPNQSSVPSPSAAATPPSPTSATASAAPPIAESGTTPDQPTATTSPTTAEETDGPDADPPHKPGKPTAPPGKPK